MICLFDDYFTSGDISNNSKPLLIQGLLPIFAEHSYYE